MRIRQPLTLTAKFAHLLLGALLTMATLPSAHCDAARPRVYLGAGLLSHDIGRLTNTATGTTSLTARIFTEIALTGEFELGGRWGLSPLFNYTPFGKTSPEGGETSKLLALGARASYWLTPNTNIRLGPGALFYQINGNGGSIVLNNGATTTTFGIPADSVTSRIFYLDAGLGAQISRLRLDLDALVSGTFSSRRAVSLITSLSLGIF